MRSYKPDYVIVAAGQDSHEDDSMSELSLTGEGYGEMTRLLVEEASIVCGGRILAVLEGGYELSSFASSNYAILSSLMGIRGTPAIEGEVKESTDILLSDLRERFLPGSFAHKTP